MVKKTEIVTDAKAEEKKKESEKPMYLLRC
jgi:hypothetical protein